MKFTLYLIPYLIGGVLVLLGIARFIPDFWDEVEDYPPAPVAIILFYPVFLVFFAIVAIGVALSKLGNLVKK